MKKTWVLIAMLMMALLISVPVLAQVTVMQGGTIQFAKGATSQIVSGRIEGGMAVRYEFYAAAGQSATIDLSSDTNRAVLGVSTLAGQRLMGVEQGSSLFGMPLPVSGGYEIIVYNPDLTATNYSFLLAIPPLAKQPTAIPAYPAYPGQQMAQSFRMGGKIQFAVGETMAVITGQADAAGCVRYDFNAGNDYLLLSNVTSDNGQAVLGLSDISGTLYLSSFSRQAVLRQILSKTTTYNIDVCNLGQTATNYKLMFVIPARIRFAPGTVSAQRSGSLRANGVVSYTAYANAGQWMTVTVKGGSTVPQVFLRVTGVDDGVVYLDHQQKQTSWSGTLPRKQDYLIEVISYQVAANYVLDVMIR